jgi:hypothetical protein
MKPFLIIILLAFASCVPVRDPSNPVDFSPLDDKAARDLLEPFRNELQARGILFKAGQAFRYDGQNERAFLAAVDRFYLERPGFCPLLENGFLLSSQADTYATLAAPLTPENPPRVAALVYDLRAKPRFVFAVYDGSSRTPLEVTRCRTDPPPR